MDANRKWHQNVMNLLLGKDVCGVCLSTDGDVVQWEDLFVFEHDDLDFESSLRQIIISTFSPSILEMVSTTKFCQKCIDEIIKAFFFIHRIQDNYKHIQKRLTEISQQMKWTECLDETGSLLESKTHSVLLNENNHVEATKEDGTQTEHVNSNISSKKTHKIFLNNESLKIKLRQDPEMHKFLDVKEEHKETKLPAGITVTKVKKTLSAMVGGPQEVLEDYDSIIPNTQLSKNTVHFNERSIKNFKGNAMKIVEAKTMSIFKAKVVEDYTTVKNSLMANLFQEPDVSDDFDHSDQNDIVPQDLLELKWPDDHNCNDTQCMKIPVKKLNFNESLTVKFIPGQNPYKCEDIDNDIAPHELLELSWNEDPDKVDTENTYLLETEQKHSIDLTKWLQDQGMSTIKTSKDSKNALENKIHKINIETASEDENNKIYPQGVEIAPRDGTFEIEENDSVKHIVHNNTPNSHGENEVDLRCALCSLTFDQFETYNSHYKTHGITEVATCFICPAKFPMIEYLPEHLLLVHSDNVSYCTICFALLAPEKLANHMSTYHSTRVKLLNIPTGKAEKANLKLEEYCKICKQPFAMCPNDPHTCIDKSSRCSECKEACIHEKYLSSYRNQLQAKKHTFKCADCKFKYKNKHDIIKHSNKVHLKHKPYTCKVCNVGFLKKTSLGKHNNLNHARCNTCRRVFEDLSSLNKHRCKAVTSGATKCELCGQTFSEFKCKQHRECALAVTDVCMICRRIVPVKCNMVRHIEYVHNLTLRKDSNGTIYDCVLCERSFKNHREFLQHSSFHTGIYECRICGRKFTSKALYKEHYQMHSTAQCDLAKWFMCSICGEELLDKNAFTNHMQAHSDHEKCRICSKYVEKTLLSSHIERHDGSKFICPHCPMICSTLTQYEVHLNRYHSKLHPYQCDTCKKCFYCKRLLRQHINNVHNKLKCSQCERQFGKKCILLYHMRTSH